jgi:hypothetical protein
MKSKSNQLRWLVVALLNVVPLIGSAQQNPDFNCNNNRCCQKGTCYNVSMNGSPSGAYYCAYGFCCTGCSSPQAVNRCTAQGGSCFNY